MAAGKSNPNSPTEDAVVSFAKAAKAPPNPRPQLDGLLWSANAKLELASRIAAEALAELGQAVDGRLKARVAQAAQTLGDIADEVLIVCVPELETPGPAANESAAP